ncbi:MAG: hypothetical protein ACK5YC_05350, partial [Planctomyces sp.]
TARDGRLIASSRLAVGSGMSSRGRPDRPRKSRFAPDWHTLDTQDPTTNPADGAGNPWMSSINEPGPRITELLR